jgi:hypothetical protein
VRSRAGAAVGVVAESVDVHAALSVGIVAGDVPCDLSVGGLVLLLEGDGALDVGVSTENGDYEALLAVVQRSNALTLVAVGPGRCLSPIWQTSLLQGSSVVAIMVLE